MSWRTRDISRSEPVSGAQYMQQLQGAEQFMQETRERLLAAGYVQVDGDTFIKRGPPMQLTVPEKCQTEGFVMPPWSEASYPLLSIARHRGLDYGDVCLSADAFIKLARDPSYTLNVWEHQANERLLIDSQHEALEEIAIVATRMPRARGL